jgi:RNA polymerase sigma factor (sigma-70 family)
MSEYAVALAPLIGLRRESERSDEELLEAIAVGDDAALGALYDRFGRVAYGVALRILRDRALAEDAVQEAFLAVWRSADSYRRERAKPSTWILTLVHRRAVDLVRREGRRRGEPLEEAPEATDA